MGNLVESVKKMMSPKGNISDKFDDVKGFMSESQKASPASKYLGVELYPGMVPSEKHRREKAVAEGQATADRIAKSDLMNERNRASMPSKSEQELMARRRAAAAKAKSGGRASTILSDETLG
jgi:hypothetical protein